MRSSNPILLGITGETASGKNVVLDNLQRLHEFEHRSARDVLSTYLNELSLEVSRENLGWVANKLRAEHGPAFVAKKLVEDLKDGLTRHTIIESLRNVSEIEYLRREFPTFVLLAVTSPLNERIQRTKIDKDLEGEKWKEKFHEQERRENDLTNKNGQHVFNCIALADYEIYNDGTLEELNAKTDKFKETLFSQ